MKKIDTLNLAKTVLKPFPVNMSPIKMQQGSVTYLFIR